MPTAQDPRCPYCFEMVFPEEYTAHLETKHPEEAEARRKWIEAMQAIADRHNILRY